MALKGAVYYVFAAYTLRAFLLISRLFKHPLKSRGPLADFDLWHVGISYRQSLSQAVLSLLPPIQNWAVLLFELSWPPCTL